MGEEGGGGGGREGGVRTSPQRSTSGVNFFVVGYLKILPRRGFRGLVCDIRWGCGGDATASHGTAGTADARRDHPPSPVPTSPS